MRVVEIGCGMHPLFENVKDFELYILYEPSEYFVNSAKKIARNDSRIMIRNEGFKFDVEVKNINPDLLVCLGLLHEVEHPWIILKDCREIMTDQTVLYINVPNVNSFHRLLAVEMGLIKNNMVLSERNYRFQQHRVFDMKRLTEMVESENMSVISSGSYFLKFFTHEQKYTILKTGAINKEVLDGMYDMGELFPDNGSEIYLNARLR